MIAERVTPSQFVGVRDLSPASGNGGTAKVTYPTSDGKPMAENTLQFSYIVCIKEGFEAQYKDDPNVFVAGDLLWYPAEGDNRIRQAPDAMIVFGRPKGYRGSYRQWDEQGIAPQVAFEIWSPGNTFTEMAKKRAFYERYGVDEYYEYDPDRGDLAGWIRRGQHWDVIENMQGWISPLTNVRFELEGSKLLLFHPDGSRFLSFVELTEQRDAAHRRADRLAAQLKALGVDPEA